MKKLLLTLAITSLVASSAFAEGKKVTVENFIRAESDNYFRKYSNRGAFGQIKHDRELFSLDEQTIVRLNRDTLYSYGVFDLTEPLTITKPDTGDRFQTMLIINQDHYVKGIHYKPGKYILKQKDIGTRYVYILIRTLIDESKPGDSKEVNALQDQFKVSQKSIGEFDVPEWDQDSLNTMRNDLMKIAATVTDTSAVFGDKDEVDPIMHLLGSAYGWGGNPPKAAIYLNVVPEKNDGKTAHTLTIDEEVPVDGFWSISMYNKEGYFEENKFGAYLINDRTAVRNDDGSIIIHFGGDPKNANYLPITEGWNYIVRLYKPSKKIINGTWVFPEPKTIN